MSFPAVLKSEWTKIRTVASTSWTLALVFLVTVGFAALFSATTDMSGLDAAERATFDPTATSFSSLQFGQLAMIVFGVLVVSTEYSTGMIKTSLAAVPNRTRFLLGKMAVATGLALAVGLVTSFVSFFLTQAFLGDFGIGIGEEHVLRAVVGAGVYMALLAVFCMGVAAMLRSSVAAISILIPFFLILSNVLMGFEATRTVGQYLPSNAGSRIMLVVPNAFGTPEAPFGAWVGLGIMVLWVIAAVIGGLLTLRKRDA